MAEEMEKQEGQKEKPLEKMTVKELREIAREIPGITGVHAMRKDQLLAVVKEAQGVKDETPTRKSDKDSGEPALSVKDLKAKIVQLRKEKETAQKEKNRKQVDALRRRISRLKKKTRKIARA